MKNFFAFFEIIESRWRT